MPKMPTIVVIGGDLTGTARVHAGLVAAGFDVVFDLKLQAGEGERPVLAILDGSSPQGRGCIAMLRTEGLPVVVLTGDGDFDRIAALEAGADDSIPASCGIRELILRVSNLLRRYHGGMWGVIESPSRGSKAVIQRWSSGRDTEHLAA